MIRETDREQAANTSRYCYLEAGTGTSTIVMLHGLFGTPDNWWSIMDELSDHYRFLALQLPIDHAGDRTYRSFRSLTQLTDFVGEFIDDMELDRVVLCGNSLGGHLALDLYLRQPERIEMLVLSGSAGLYENSLSGGPLRLSRRLVHKHACEIFHDSVHVTDELVDHIFDTLSDRNYRRFLLRVAKATRDRSMADELAKVDVPTMIIWGSDDSITPPFVAEQFRDSIRGAELVYLDECGHAPPIEQPRAFARELHGFLSAASTTDRDHVIRKPR